MRLELYLSLYIIVSPSAKEGVGWYSLDFIVHFLDLSISTPLLTTLFTPTPFPGSLSPRPTEGEKRRGRPTEREKRGGGVHRGQTYEAVFVFLFRKKSFTLTWKHQ